MLLEQYMTPVNIIIAVILVVLGYLAYKKYQKSSGSYEHVEPLGNDQTNYTLVKTTIKSDIYIAPEINSIIKKFDKDPQQLGDVLHKFSIRIGSQSYSNIIEIKLYLDPESLYKTKINYKRTGPIEIAKKVNINNFPSINVGITVNGDNIAINKRVTKTKDKYTSSGLEFDISSEINSIKQQLTKILNNVTFKVSQFYSPNQEKNYISSIQIQVLAADKSNLINLIDKGAHKIGVEYVNRSKYTNLNEFQAGECPTCPAPQQCPQQSCDCPSCPTGQELLQQ